MTLSRYPLSGLKILDFSRFQQGPAATVLQSDLGASVIKVEPPGGELGRRIGTDPAGGYSPMFETYNRNKRSMTLRLDHPHAREVIWNLVREIDIVLENFRPGVMESFGIGFEDLRRHKPDIVMVSATGYGTRGEWAGRPAFDIAAQALSGIMWLQGGGPGHDPVHLTPGVGDQVSSIMVTVACLGGLIARDRYGEAQHVEVSLLGTLMTIQGHYLARFMAGEALEDTAARPAPTFGRYRTADGWLVIAVIDPKDWQRLCQALGLRRLAEDERFRNSWVRRSNRDALERILGDTFLKRTREEWIGRLIAQDIAAAPVYDYDEALASGQPAANDYIVEREHPQHGKVRLLGCPISFRGLQTGPRGFAPELGQDTEDILLQTGYSWDEIEKFRESGLIEVWDSDNAE